MSTITLPYDISNGDALDADKVMADLEAVTTEYNTTVGGLSGDLLTTTNTKTVTGKTFTSPKINEDVAVTATATELNLLGGKTSLAINRAFTWSLPGTSVDGVAEQKYIAPQNMTVIKVYGILTSGNCTVTLKKGATTIDAINCSSTLATETSITSAAITAGDVITLTISSASSPVALAVTMETSQP